MVQRGQWVLRLRNNEKKRSKRYKDLVKNSKDKSKLKLNDIIERLKKNANSKFEESIDVSVKINIKQSKGGDVTIRSILKLPNGTGKKYRIAVLCEPDKVMRQNQVALMYLAQMT